MSPVFIIRTALSAMINLCVGYISEANIENNKSIIKVWNELFRANEHLFLLRQVLSIMKYCLEKGSPQYLSALKDQRDVIGQLTDKFIRYPQLETLVKNILELLGPAVENRDSLGLIMEPPLPQTRLPDHFSTFISEIKLKDLTPYVELKSPYALGGGGYGNVYLAKLVTDRNRSEDVRVLVSCSNMLTNKSFQVAKKVLVPCSESDDSVIYFKVPFFSIVLISNKATTRIAYYERDKCMEWIKTFQRRFALWIYKRWQRSYRAYISVL